MVGGLLLWLGDRSSDECECECEWDGDELRAASAWLIEQLHRRTSSADTRSSGCRPMTLRRRERGSEEADDAAEEAEAEAAAHPPIDLLRCASSCLNDASCWKVLDRVSAEAADDDEAVSAAAEAVGAAAAEAKTATTTGEDGAIGSAAGSTPHSADGTAAAAFDATSCSREAVDEAPAEGESIASMHARLCGIPSGCCCCLR